MLWDKKKPFDYKKFRREFAYWMQRDYFYSGREYNYKGIDRKIFWEEFIESDDKAGLTDWRFMCFGGQVKFVMVDIGTMDTGGGILCMQNETFTTETSISCRSRLHGKIFRLTWCKSPMAGSGCWTLQKSFQSPLSIAA